MSTIDYSSLTVGQIVAADFVKSAVFARLGIDFCCHGGTPFGEACRAKGLDPDDVSRQLDGVHEAGVSGSPVFRDWPLDLLVDYVLKIHHRNIRARGPKITELLDKVVRVHGGRHPELAEVSLLFRESLADLESHLSKEEQVLFPYVYQMCDAVYSGCNVAPFACGTIQHPVAVMEDEHSQEGERFGKIASLTGEFTPPEDACGSYRLVMQLLREFRDALHEHIHIENNIIFPTAIAMEKKMNGE